MTDITWLPILLLVLASGPAAAHDFTSITRTLAIVPSPPQGQSEWVARSMRLNGLPMTLKSFQSRLTPDAVLRHYESTIGARGAASSFRTRQGHCQTLSIRDHAELITIEAQATIAGSTGTIAVTPMLNVAQLRVETSFPRPATTSVVNLQEFDDDGIEAEHISLSSVRSVVVEAQGFAQALQRAGWQMVRLQPMKAAPSGRVLEAQKGAQQAFLTITRNGVRPATSIVVVWRKS